jgi:predicted RNA-binding protein
MCESTAYLRTDNTEEEILGDVVKLVPEGDKIILTNLLGDTKEITGKIDHIDLMNHKIVLVEK